MSAMSEISRLRQGYGESRRTEGKGEIAQSSVVGARSSATGHPVLSVALLTGGGDKPYALGMAAALTSAGVHVDFIGSNDLRVPELLTNRRVNFLNLRGDQRENVGFRRKVVRILAYYARLITYVVRSQPQIIHILWNNKFEYFDR